MARDRAGDLHSAALRGAGFIFATSISKHSARPYETVKPLSNATGIPIDAIYADQDYGRSPRRPAQSAAERKLID